MGLDESVLSSLVEHWKEIAESRGAEVERWKKKWQEDTDVLEDERAEAAEYWNAEVERLRVDINRARGLLAVGDAAGAEDVLGRSVEALKGGGE
jgi:hypothetical protein